MRKLESLCRRLRRVGICAIVTKHPGEPYVVRWGSVGTDYDFYNSDTFRTVKSVEQFLLTLWR